MRFFAGLAFVLCGLYFLGKNVMFTTRWLPYFWQDFSAAGAVLCIVFGVIALIFLNENLKKAGWVLIFLAVVLVFVHARVFIKPTSLWTFFLGIVSMAAGFKIMHSQRD